MKVGAREVESIQERDLPSVSIVMCEYKSDEGHVKDALRGISGRTCSGF